MPKPSPARTRPAETALAPGASGKILMIDDDRRLQEAIKSFLKPHGFSLNSLPDGREALTELERIKPDMVLLDVMLPYEDGFSLLRRLRAKTTVPVLMLTARGRDEDRINGLDMGADDYLAKPFNPRELVARIKAVLRRAAAVPQANDSTPETLEVGELSLDVKNHSLSRRGRSRILPAAEFHIARSLMSHVNETLSRDEMLSLSFGQDYYVNDRLIDVYISHLRRTLRDLGENSAPIRTVWGSGYRWEGRAE